MVFVLYRCAFVARVSFRFFRSRTGRWNGLDSRSFCQALALFLSAFLVYRVPVMDAVVLLALLIYYLGSSIE